ncbi:MAG: hypothetical protein Q7V62_01760, partial [Actinomycetota bacterium]|nr:hypothetical protein [Actinomycetota bacterium]
MVLVADTWYAIWPAGGDAGVSITNGCVANACVNVIVNATLGAAGGDAGVCTCAHPAESVP